VEADVGAVAEPDLLILDLFGSDFPGFFGGLRGLPELGCSRCDTCKNKFPVLSLACEIRWHACLFYLNPRDGVKSSEIIHT
jgi:hypothetical protein